MSDVVIGGGLVIDFAGSITRLGTEKQLTFGRSADLEIDDNRNLHRVLGRFYCEKGLWWIRNEGRAIAIRVADADSRSSATIAPGRTLALTFAEALVRFRAGLVEYELVVTQPSLSHAEPSPIDRTELDQVDVTVSARSVPLTDDQRLVLVVMAESALRDPHAPVVVASNAAMAHRIGWTLSRFNRKIDNLCAKFTKAGVAGLHGTVDELAKNRRRTLVEHCVAVGIIGTEDLILLDDLRVD